MKVAAVVALSVLVVLPAEADQRHRKNTRPAPLLRQLVQLLPLVEDGRLAWGHSLSTVASTSEVFAWAISADNKAVVGADTDGYFQVTVMSPDRIEMC
jgi:hypothetical protein